MAIKIQGRLTIVERNGRHGRWCVGNLVTEIGEFVIKDALLDQFEPGTYAGEFWIEKIYCKTNVGNNRVFVDVIAQLADLNIDPEGVAIGKSECPPATSEDEPGTPDIPVALPNPNKPFITDPLIQSPATADTLDQLFEPDIAKQVRNRATAIILDPAVERSRLSAQTGHLKQLGYRWNPPSKSWLFAA